MFCPLLHSLPAHQWLSCKQESLATCVRVSGTQLVKAELTTPGSLEHFMQALHEACVPAYTYFKLHLPMHITPLRALAHCWLPRSCCLQILAQNVTFQISNIIYRKFLCCRGVAIVSEISVVLLAERVKAEFDRDWCSQPWPKVSSILLQSF